MKAILLAAALVLPIITQEPNPPAVKEGLWSARTQSIENPGDRKSSGSYTLCRTHAYDAAVRALADKMKGCTKASESSQGNTYSSALRCVVAGSVVESRGTTIFQGDTSFHSETHATYTPPVYGMSETVMIVDQRYLGNCPAGAQPGDRTMPDGRVIHSNGH